MTPQPLSLKCAAEDCLKQLNNVVRMAELVAGGKKTLEDNPIISFITCLVKSPLQFVDDTTATFIEVCRRGLPIVVSSSPQAGTTAPIKEAGIMAQINAEVLAGITLGQLVKPGTPVLYGSVPVRARMDTLGDSRYHGSDKCGGVGRHNSRANGKTRDSSALR